MRRRRAVSLPTSAGIAAVPAVADDDDDAARAQDAPRPVLVELAERRRRCASRRTSRRPRPPPARAPGRGRGRAAGGVTRVRRVPKTNASVRTSRPGQRLAEAQQQPGVALHRAADVADQDDRRAAAARAAPQPRRPGRRPWPGCAGTSARGAQQPPAAVRAPSGASGASRSCGTMRSMSALRLAQLGGGHAVEVAVAQRLAGAVGVGRDGERPRRRPRRRSSATASRSPGSGRSTGLRPCWVGAASLAIVAISARRLAAGGADGPWRRQNRSKTRS